MQKLKNFHDPNRELINLFESFKYLQFAILTNKQYYCKTKLNMHLN